MAADRRATMMPTFLKLKKESCVLACGITPTRGRSEYMGTRASKWPFSGSSLPRRGTKEGLEGDKKRATVKLYLTFRVL